MKCISALLLIMLLLPTLAEGWGLFSSGHKKAKSASPDDFVQNPSFLKNFGQRRIQYLALEIIENRCPSQTGRFLRHAGTYAIKVEGLSFVSDEFYGDHEKAVHYTDNSSLPERESESFEGVRRLLAKANSPPPSPLLHAFIDYSGGVDLEATRLHEQANVEIYKAGCAAVEHIVSDYCKVSEEHKRYGNSNGVGYKSSETFLEQVGCKPNSNANFRQRLTYLTPSGEHVNMAPERIIPVGSVGSQQGGYHFGGKGVSYVASLPPKWVEGGRRRG